MFEYLEYDLKKYMRTQGNQPLPREPAQREACEHYENKLWRDRPGQLDVASQDNLRKVSAPVTRSWL